MLPLPRHWAKSLFSACLGTVARQDPEDEESAGKRMEEELSAPSWSMSGPRQGGGAGAGGGEVVSDPHVAAAGGACPAENHPGPAENESGLPIISVTSSTDLYVVFFPS